MCVEDKLEESNTRCSAVRKANNEASPSYKSQFVGTLTGQRCELKSRSVNNLYGVNLNTVILVDRTTLRIFKTNIKC